MKTSCFDEMGRGCRKGLSLLVAMLVPASCLRTQPSGKPETLDAMFHTWAAIECPDSTGKRMPCLVDPSDSSVGHQLKILDFRESGLCSLEVMPFFVSRSSDTVASASDGGFWKAAGRYTLSGDTIRVTGRIYGVHYLGKSDSLWQETFLRAGETLRSDLAPNPYVRKPGYLRRILTGIKRESYLAHYDR